MSRGGRLPNPIRAAGNAARRIHDTSVAVEAMRRELAELRSQLDAATDRLDRAQAGVDDGLRRTTDLLHAADGDASARHAQVVEILHLLRDDEPANRERLWTLRSTPEYELAFEEPEPLVSFCIATYASTRTLLERALPSVLAQTYERIEVVIVGDAAAPEVGDAVRKIGDPRVRYANMSMRGPYPEDPAARWHVAGGPPLNEAMRLARGRWIAGMDDDDEATPDRVELLLGAARARRLELSYGRLEMRSPSGAVRHLGTFPPAWGEIGIQSTLVHAGLRFVAPELSDALFGLPGDWSRIRRMMRMGVRMGMIDDVVVRYYPNREWADESQSASGTVSPGGAEA
jgi:hypothetical protein